MTSSDIISTRSSQFRFCGFFLFSLLFLVTLAPILFLFPQNIYAFHITLAWDANTEEDLAGYRVFCRQEGESYNYNDPAKELWLTVQPGQEKEQLEDPNEPSCTIQGLVDTTTYYFVGRAFDTSGNESGDSNEVCYQPNLAPIADAGADQTVDEAATVMLDGSNSSDLDGSIVSYLWTQTAGTSVTLSDATSPTPTFTAPNVGTDGDALTFQLTVTDDGGLQATDDCIVTVSWVDESPVLSSVSITGASLVNENSTSNYTATATFSDASTQTVTESTIWSEDSEYASINNTGVLSTSEVTWNETVTITSTYSYGSVTQTAMKVVTISDIPQSNLAPRKPVIYSPYDGQTGLELRPVIITEDYSHPDGDTHGQSQWQMSKDFGNPGLIILDITSTDHLTELPVPHTILEAGTTYYVRVRFYDDYGKTSDWSDTVEFTTTSDVNDFNTNGIPDDQEVGYEVDLNQDHIPDIEEPNKIKSVKGTDGTALAVSKVSNSITAIEAIEAIDPSEIAERIRRPKKFIYGLISYRLSLDVPGATATVRIYCSRDISRARAFYKYDTINGWQNYSQHITFNNDGRSLTVEVKDGGHGDSDGVANGVIADPGVLAEAVDADETTEGADSAGDSGSSSGGGCFIATAAFGSYAEPHVKLLRDFRDQCLLTNIPGRCFVRMYYRYSPFWADLINIHTWCKPIVRLALMPLVGFSYVLVKASLSTKMIAGLLLAGFVLGCFLRVHGRPITGGEKP